MTRPSVILRHSRSVTEDGQYMPHSVLFSFDTSSALPQALPGTLLCACGYLHQRGVGFACLRPVSASGREWRSDCDQAGDVERVPIVGLLTPHLQQFFLKRVAYHSQVPGGLPLHHKA